MTDTIKTFPTETPNFVKLHNKRISLNHSAFLNYQSAPILRFVISNDSERLMTRSRMEASILAREFLASNDSAYPAKYFRLK